MSVSVLDLTVTWEEVASQLPRNASDTNRLMAAIYYRFEHEEADQSDVITIENEYFLRARWPHPTNLAATANHCASKGWLSASAQSGGRKLWRITRKGYEHISTQLQQSA